MAETANGTPNGSQGAEQPTLLYCHCAYAKVVPQAVRDEVLAGLSAAGHAFEAVPDLCEMSARKDPALARLAGCGPLKIAACFPRAVNWLFHAAKTPLAEGAVEVLNMRTQGAEEILERMFAADLRHTPVAEPADEMRELAEADSERTGESETEGADA